MSSEKTAVQPFEESLGELEAVVRRLEAGDLPLEEALGLFERGVGLSRQCRATLDSAQRRVEILLKRDDGMRSPVPFEEAEPNVDENN